MAVKYVKDFSFDKSFGYTGSAGTGPVSNNERAMGTRMGQGPVSSKEQTIVPSVKAGAKMGTDSASNATANRAAQAIADANRTPKPQGDSVINKKPRVVDDSMPTAEEIVKMRQAREYMKEDKATSDAAKREMGFKKGGLKVTEKATGERYPSKSAMVKHEKTETPRMQREELVQKQVVRGPAMAAGRDPRIPMFKCGGKAKK